MTQNIINIRMENEATGEILHPETNSSIVLCSNNATLENNLNNINKQIRDINDSVSNAKQDIVNALNNKGENATNDMTFSQLVDLITNLNVAPSDLSAIGHDVLSINKKIYKEVKTGNLGNGILPINSTEFFFVDSSYAVCKYDIDTMTKTATGIKFTSSTKPKGYARRTADGQYILYGLTLYNSDFSEEIYTATVGERLYLDEAGENIYVAYVSSSTVYVKKVTPTVTSATLTTVATSTLDSSINCTDFSDNMIGDYIIYATGKYYDSSHVGVAINTKTGDVINFSSGMGTYVDIYSKYYGGVPYVVTFTGNSSSSSRTLHHYKINLADGFSVDSEGYYSTSDIPAPKLVTSIYTENINLWGLNRTTFCYETMDVNEEFHIVSRRNEHKLLPVMITDKYIVMDNSSMARVYEI